MIKIKLLSRMAGPEGNFASGSILDVEIEMAKQLVEGNYAELLEPLPVIEPKEIPKPVKKAGVKK